MILIPYLVLSHFLHIGKRLFHPFLLLSALFRGSRIINFNQLSSPQGAEKACSDITDINHINPLPSLPSRECQH